MHLPTAEAGLFAKGGAANYTVSQPERFVLGKGPRRRSLLRSSAVLKGHTEGPVSSTAFQCEHPRVCSAEWAPADGGGDD